MTNEYRVVTADDIEQLVDVEARAFYNTSTPERVELTRRLIPPDWTVAAFVDGRLVASVRSIPMVRRINGGGIGLGAVGPVACLAEYRRQGHVGRLLRLALERMRDQGQAMSGLYTPHDALYARYGWERAEGRKSYKFEPKSVQLRRKGARGRIEKIGPDDWRRLDAVYRTYAEHRNGPFHRNEMWWREAVITDHGATTRLREAQVWSDASGADQGYVVYANYPLASENRWPRQMVLIKDIVALTGDAYAGLWEHMLTHDLADRIVVETPLDDPFRDMVEDPWSVDVSVEGGAMLRIVDIERAFAGRPYVGQAPVSFTMRIDDPTAPWNDGAWLVEAAEGSIRLGRTERTPDVELSANTLAPLFTAHMRPDVAASVGLLRVNRPQALTAMAQAFTAWYPPFCNDTY